MPTNPRAFGPAQEQSAFRPGQPLNTGQPRTGLSRLSGGGEFRSATAMEELPSFRRTGVGRLDAGMGEGPETPEGPEGAQAGAGLGSNPFDFDFNELFSGLFGGEGETAGQGSPLARLLSQFEREDPQAPDFGNLGAQRSQAWQDAKTAIQGLKTAKQGFDIFNPTKPKGPNVPLEGLSGASAGISAADRLASLLSAAFAPEVLSGAAGFSLSGLGGAGAINGLTASQLGVTAADLGASAGAGAAGAGAGAGAGTGAGASSGLASGIGTAAQALPYLAAAYSIADRGANSQYSSDQQAAMAAIEALGAALAGPTGGLSSIIALGANSFFKPELTHNQREALEFSRMGKTFNAHVLPRLRGAQSIEELAGAFAPEGTWGQDTGTIMANGRPITHPDVLEMLRGGLQDPGQVTLDWQQGINEEKRAYLNDVLNNMVRQQLALIGAAQAGDPKAISILQSMTAGRDFRRDFLPAIQSGQGTYRFTEQGTPIGFDPSFDWERAQQLVQAAGGSDPEIAGWQDTIRQALAQTRAQQPANDPRWQGM